MTWKVGSELSMGKALSRVKEERLGHDRGCLVLRASCLCVAIIHRSWVRSLSSKLESSPGRLHREEMPVAFL